jgi:hypothetical protein
VLASSGPTTVSYVVYFSGVGAYWNSTTASEFETAIQGQFATVDPSSVNVAPQDFPVAMGVTLLGVNMNTFNSISHLQDQVQAAIGEDASVNGTSQVNLGAFLQTPAGLYLPFTFDNLGTNPTTASDIISSVFTDGSLISTSSALSTTLATNGINCQLAWAPPNSFPANLPSTPSTGVMLQISVAVANATEAATAVAVNMFDVGLLIQELNANGVTLGPLYGGTVVQTHTVTVTAPGGVAVPTPVPAYDQVFVASTDHTTGVVSAAPRAARAAAAGALAAVLAVIAMAA